MPAIVPIMPSQASRANRDIVTIASVNAATRTGLCPQDCERRPQN